MKYIPRKKWKHTKGNICKICNVSDFLNEDGVCIDCYYKAIEKEYFCFHEKARLLISGCKTIPEAMHLLNDMKNRKQEKVKEE